LPDKDGLIEIDDVTKMRYYIVDNLEKGLKKIKADMKFPL